MIAETNGGTRVRDKVRNKVRAWLTLKTGMRTSKTLNVKNVETFLTLRAGAFLTLTTPVISLSIFKQILIHISRQVEVVQDLSI